MSIQTLLKFIPGNCQVDFHVEHVESVGILQYGPLPWKRSFRIFFSLTPAKFKLQKRKKIKKVKVWSWHKTNERGEHLCLEKALFNSLYRLFDVTKKLVNSESKSMANFL